ncbi:MAG: hypothetical protein DCC71_06910, partial [Proteobacteria bacterium]
LACGGAPDDGAVRVWAFGHEGEALQRLARQFERERPGRAVRVQRIPWSAAHEKLLTGFVGETLPDVFQLGATWIAELAALGALEPLDARVAASRAVDRADWFDGAWETSVVDGRLVALPWYVDTRVLFYRSDLLAEAGVAEAPRTWAAWEDAMAKLAAARGRGRHAILAPLTEWELPVVLALSNGATLLRDGDRYGNFRSDAFREAFAFHLSWFERGFAARAGASATASVYRDFAEGWFCFYLSGPWNLGQMAERLPPALAGAWTTAPVPGRDDTRPGVSLAGGASLAIRAGSPRADAAWEWVEWLAAPAQQLALYRATGDLPSRRSAWRDPALAGDPRAQAFRVQLDSVRALPRVPEWERIAARISRASEAAIRGEASIDAALAALDADVDRILAKRRALLDRAARSADESLR